VELPSCIESLSQFVTRVISSHPRITSVILETDVSPVLIVCVYMPTNYGNAECHEEFIATCAHVTALYAECSAVHLIVAGDFNILPKKCLHLFQRTAAHRIMLRCALQHVAARLNAFKRNATHSRSGNRPLAVATSANPHIHNPLVNHSLAKVLHSNLIPNPISNISLNPALLFQTFPRQKTSVVIFCPVRQLWTKSSHLRKIECTWVEGISYFLSCDVKSLRIALAVFSNVSCYFVIYYVLFCAVCCK